MTPIGYIVTQGGFPCTLYNASAKKDTKRGGVLVPQVAGNAVEVFTQSRDALRAIKRTFGDFARKGLLVSGTKSMTGHLLGAAGGIELAASVLALRDQVVPPTINVENPDPEVDVDIVANEARPAKVSAALSNSFGFGGHNSALLVKKFEG